VNSGSERDLGEQPIAKIMITNGLKPTDLVRHSSEQITHKMVGRAIKGRKLTPHVQLKVLNALNAASKCRYTLKDLFTY
jgi:hypothetical protein